MPDRRSPAPRSRNRIRPCRRALCFGGRPVGIEIRMLVFDQQFEVFCRRPHDRGARDIGLCLTEIASVEQILVPALVDVHVHRELRREGVDDRPGHRSHRIIIGPGALVEAGVYRSLCGNRELVAGILGVDQHGTAGDIASEQQSLRPPEHFDAFEVEHVQEHAGGNAHIHPVDKNADGGIDGWNGAVDAEPPNREIGDARDRRDVVELHVWHRVGEVAEIPRN